MIAFSKGPVPSEHSMEDQPLPIVPPLPPPPADRIVTELQGSFDGFVVVPFKRQQYDFAAFDQSSGPTPRRRDGL